MDWAGIKVYQADNLAWAQAAADTGVVFIGDSLTYSWDRTVPDFFRAGWLNRGLNSQTTPQMLVRFRQDVIDLRPRAVHIMGGTNDLFGATGPMTVDETMGNIMSMVELARAHAIGIVLALLPPSHPGIAGLNRAIAAYAADADIILADYYAVLDDGEGHLRAAFTYDRLHLNADGYVAIAALTLAALRSTGA